MRGRLITFSGVDGAGKSTLATAVHQALRARGLRVEAMEFGDSRVWRLITFLRHRDRALAATLDATAVGVALNLERTAFLLDHVGPALESNDVVLLQRYFWDWMAVGAAYGADPGELDMLDAMERALRMDPLSVFVDTAPDLAAERLCRRGVPLDERETLAMLVRAHHTYVDVLSGRRAVLGVPGDLTTTAQLELVLDHLGDSEDVEQRGAWNVEKIG